MFERRRDIYTSAALGVVAAVAFALSTRPPRVGDPVVVTAGYFAAAVGGVIIGTIVFVGVNALLTRR